MRRKELTKTYVIISNLNKTLVFMVYTTNFNVVTVKGVNIIEAVIHVASTPFGLIVHHTYNDQDISLALSIFVLWL